MIIFPFDSDFKVQEEVCDNCKQGEYFENFDKTWLQKQHNEEFFIVEKIAK